jgi:putative chitinase
MTDPRKAVFDSVRGITPSNVFNVPENIQALHNLLDAFGAKRETNLQRRMHDNSAFYMELRKLTGPLNQVQVNTIEGLFKAASHWTVGWLAYGLATAWHECRLQPIEEWGKGKGKRYGVPDKYSQAPYGRGLVQLTWDYNYEWADKVCSDAGMVPRGAILKDFSLVMRPDIATLILVKGMETGAFTKRKLADYIGHMGTPETFTQARRIINGTDKAVAISEQAMKIQSAIILGQWS